MRGLCTYRSHAHVTRESRLQQKLYSPQAQYDAVRVLHVSPHTLVSSYTIREDTLKVYNRPYIRCSHPTADYSNVPDCSRGSVTDTLGTCYFQSDSVNFTLMFIAASSAARNLNTYGMATLSTPLLVPHTRHSTFRFRPAPNPPASCPPKPYPVPLKFDWVERRLPQVEQTSVVW
jgi:hypothetical protein